MLKPNGIDFPLERYIIIKTLLSTVSTYREDLLLDILSLRSITFDIETWVFLLAFFLFKKKYM